MQHSIGHFHVNKPYTDQVMLFKARGLVIMPHYVYLNVVYDDIKLVVWLSGNTLVSIIEVVLCQVGLYSAWPSFRG